MVICSGCNKRFEKLPYLVRSTNYCSVKCYYDSTRIKHSKKCRTCGVKFTPTATQIRNGYGIYCSRSCQNRPHLQQQVIIKCQQCGKSLKKSPAVAKKTKYCSKACHNAAMSDYVDKKCANCDMTFTTPRSVINTGRGKFCSRKCFTKYNGESRLEEKVRLYLENMEISFVQEKKFGRYHADFFLKDKKIIIECDGEYWHNSKASKERDYRKDIYLHKLGYQVVRITGAQIDNNLSKHIDPYLSI